ncbi:DUF4302 domain-containing protein [Bacteroides thetaiotaomicron]|uniref:DUF4302 domain-containing protein n=1 Tax=Bacteroides thetaiotaomicron TaxID=818 RepID=UPI0039C1E9B8
MKTGFQLLILIAVCFSCKDENIFDSSPSERSAKHISELRKELIDAPHGWCVTYFPRIDSLLFTNVNEQITQFEYRNKYGYGGHCFFMKFADDGTVETIADYDEQSGKNSRKSEFEVSQNTFTQLSFTTYNYLHSLVNDRFAASSDFLYTGKDADGNLVFRTASYIEPAREYMVFTKLKSENSWVEDMHKAYANNLFFQEMKNPQLVIRKAGRIYFRSDMQTRTIIDNRDENSKKKKKAGGISTLSSVSFCQRPLCASRMAQRGSRSGIGICGHNRRIDVQTRHTIQQKLHVLRFPQRRKPLCL